MTRSRAVVTVSVWLVLSLALAATDARPSVVALFGIVAIVATTIILVLDLDEATMSIRWYRPRVRRRASRGVDQRVSSLRSQLYSARWLGSNEVRVALVELVDDRLLVHRQIDRSADPAAAMNALTPTLRRLVDGSRRSSIAARELDRILDDIEAL